jgi:hypothetical protein
MLNSRLTSLYYKQRAVKSDRKIFPKVVIRNVREFPYPRTIEPLKRDQLARLVEQTLKLHETLQQAKIERERTVIQHQITAKNQQIDQLVYELFGLTDEEIAMVEEAAAS